MEITTTQILKGPNIWSKTHTRLVQVHLNTAGTWVSPDKYTQLKDFLNHFYIKFCGNNSRNFPPEYFDSTPNIAQIYCNVAIALQCAAGYSINFTRVKETINPHVFAAVFMYENEEAGLYAVDAALEIVKAWLEGQTVEMEIFVAEIRRIKSGFALGPSTLSIVKEAESRGIPWQRLNRQSSIQLGYGKNRRLIRATITGNTSFSAVNITDSKERTKNVLRGAGIPVPDGGTCTTLEEMHKLVGQLTYPLVIKPLDSNHGNGVCINVCSPAEAEAAFHHASAFSNTVIVERYIKGDDFRLLVINGKFIAASHRLPAHVVGDGRSTIRQLVDKVNRDPNRGNGHESVLTKIIIDCDSDRLLAAQNFTLDSIPAEGEKVALKSTANLSTGGTATDVTDEVHPANRFMAERIATTIGLDICGIDLIANDLIVPVDNDGGAVIEVNAAPGFRMHISPSGGTPRNPAKAVVDMLYPEGSSSRIPIFAVTGTNGKTTTTRLLAHLAQSAGHTVGYTTTDGVYVGGHQIMSGDCSGPGSAGVVLRDPLVDFAVLETARGGLLRAGLAFDKCDVGIITNIQEDHLGLNEIHTLDDLARVKAVIAHSVQEAGHAVLNADDPYCVEIAAELTAPVVYFSLDANSPVVEKHVAHGGAAVILEQGQIIIIEGSDRTVMADVCEIPLTMHGTAKFMIANILAATAGAYFYGFESSQIRQAWSSFYPGLETTPGRMNLYKIKDFSVLVDYAHNPHGMRALKDYLVHVEAKRKIGIISGVGDRRDSDIIELAAIGAEMFDYIIVRQEHSLRGRTLDEMNCLMARGITRSNPQVDFVLIPEEADAIRHALMMAETDDYIVALSDDYRKVIDVIERFRDGECEQMNADTAVVSF